MRTEHWNELHIPDLAGRTALVTGANGGIGYETARALAEHGAHVVLACRDIRRGADAEVRIEEREPSGSVEVLRLDLADLDSVSTAAAEFRAKHQQLDLLINNAGLMAPPRSKTVQGFEMQFGVNHLGHFALTGHLLPTLIATDGSRVVTVSSFVHHLGRIDLDDLNAKRKYSAWRSYFQSKLANLLFTNELQRRLTAARVPTIAVGSHPGTADTNLGHDNRLIKMLRRHISAARFGQSASMGALPTLRAATDPAVSGGAFFGPRGVFQQQGLPVLVSASRRAGNEALAARLWTVSVAATGCGYAALHSPNGRADAAD